MVQRKKVKLKKAAAKPAEPKRKTVKEHLEAYSKDKGSSIGGAGYLNG